MRRVFLAIVMIGSASAASAADYFDPPVLRGSLSENNWQGVYVGGQFGTSSSNFDVSGASSGLQALAGTLLVSSTISTLPGYDKTTTYNYGGFVGYNWQFDDAVLGVDINYASGGHKASSVILPKALGGVVNGTTYALSQSGNASMDVTDYGSLRLRGGWAAGRYMPYATLGAAFGRADLSRVVTLTGTADDGLGGGPQPYSVTASQSKKGAAIFGYSFGGGLDVNVFSGLFVRAEVERTLFYSTWGMDTVITSGRLGAGYRF